MKGAVAAMSYAGAHHRLTVALASGARLTVSVPAGDADLPTAPGAPVWSRWAPDATVMVDGD